MQLGKNPTRIEADDGGSGPDGKDGGLSMPAREPIVSQPPTAAAGRLQPDAEMGRKGREGLTTKHWAAVLLLLPAFAYGPAFAAGFIWDDDDYVQNNLNLRSAK